jgi:hypothetical protein
MNRVVFRLGVAIVWITASILAVVSLLGESWFWRLLGLRGAPGGHAGDRRGTDRASRATRR